jgi:hypothetical protein
MRFESEQAEKHAGLEWIEASAWLVDSIIEDEPTDSAI